MTSRFWGFVFCLVLPLISAFETHSDEWWKDLTLIIHRNGEPDPCGTAIPKSSRIRSILFEETNKYDLEAIMTDLIAGTLTEERACLSPDNSTAASQGLYGFCDMGPDRTPILLDHGSLKPVQGGSLPCRWYTREGMRIISLNQLQTLVDSAKRSSLQTCAAANPQQGECNNVELHLYGVPAGRVFMFAPSYVGEVYELSHMTLAPDPENKPISMEVLSLNPRVFDIFNVFTPAEADGLVERALKETSPTHKIKRSTTGVGENSVFNKRTSENAFDTHGNTALAVKQ
jgi:hypothetical protein